MQLQLPFIFVLTPPKNRHHHEPKVEPHRVQLDRACDTVAALCRAAVETPSQANLRALTDAVMAAHTSLLTVNFVETSLASTASAAQ